MADEEREPYSWDIVEIGAPVGHIQQLTSQKHNKKKNPIGFAAPARKRKYRGKYREPGTWPEVPYFDERG